MTNARLIRYRVTAMLCPDDYEELVWLAEYAVCKSWMACRRQDPSTVPDEVDQTFRLMRWTTRYLATLWKPIFERRGIPMRMSGVFCHKTPLATFEDENGAKATCELGDLLIVHDHLGSKPSRRAALMQAKRTAGGTAKATDPVQNDLYRRLPKFRLSRRGHKGTHFKQGDRDLGHATDLARFALVADDAAPWICTDDEDSDLYFWPPGFQPWRPAWLVAHPAQDPVSSIGAETFGSFLSSMLFLTHPSRGQTLEPILNLADAKLGSGKDPDITVQELLDITAKRVANSQHAWGGLPRGVVAFQLGSLPASNQGNPLPPLPELTGSEADPPDGSGEVREDEDDGEGISILLIETFGD